MMVATELGEDVTHDDAHVAGAHGARRVDVVVLLDRQDGAPEDACDGGPSQDADRDEHVLEARADHRQQGDDEQDVRERQEDVGKTHDDDVPDTAVVGGQGAHDQAEDRGDRRGEQADGKRDAGAVDDAREHVTAGEVGAEGMLQRRGQQRLGRRLGGVQRRGVAQRLETDRSAVHVTSTMRMIQIRPIMASLFLRRRRKASPHRVRCLACDVRLPFSPPSSSSRMGLGVLGGTELKVLPETASNSTPSMVWGWEHP